MGRALHIAAASAALILAGTAPAAAAGPPVESWTEHITNLVEVTTDVHPCTGQPAEITAVMSGVIHFVAQPDGKVHITGMLHGTFTADALPTDGTPDATGMFQSTFGGNGMLLEEGQAVGRATLRFTDNGRVRNADGSTDRWHRNGTSVYDGDGLPRLETFHERLNCSGEPT